jgi:hypothetical protein
VQLLCELLDGIPLRQLRLAQTGHLSESHIILGWLDADSDPGQQVHLIERPQGRHR